MSRIRNLKDGRRVELLEHVNVGEGWHVVLADAKTPREHIPFVVSYGDFEGGMP